MLGASGPHTNKVDTNNLCCSNSGVCRWRAGKLAPRQYATGAAATADRSPRPPRRRIALKVLGRGAEAPCRILRRPPESRNATCSASAAGMVSCVHIMFGRVLRRKLPVTGHLGNMLGVGLRVVMAWFPPAPYDGQVRCILFAMKGLPSDAGRSQKVKVVLSIFIKDLPDRRGPLKLVIGEQMLSSKRLRDNFLQDAGRKLFALLRVACAMDSAEN